MTQPEETPPRDGGGFSSKIGPLPAWAWIGIATVGGVVVLLWMRSRKTASTVDTTAPSSVSPDTAEVQNLQDQLGVVNSQIRNLQGGSTTPTGAAPGTPTRTAIITGGQGLNDFLKRYGISADQFLSLNPDVVKYLRTTNAGGFGAGGPDSLAFDLPNGTPIVVQIPLVTPPPLRPVSAPATNGHAISGVAG